MAYLTDLHSPIQSHRKGSRDYPPRGTMLSLSIFAGSTSNRYKSADPHRLFPAPSEARSMPKWHRKWLHLPPPQQHPHPTAKVRQSSAGCDCCSSLITTSPRLRLRAAKKALKACPRSGFVKPSATNSVPFKWSNFQGPPGATPSRASLRYDARILGCLVLHDAQLRPSDPQTSSFSAVECVMKGCIVVCPSNHGRRRQSPGCCDSLFQCQKLCQHTPPANHDAGPSSAGRVCPTDPWAHRWCSANHQASPSHTA